MSSFSRIEFRQAKKRVDEIIRNRRAGLQNIPDKCCKKCKHCCGGNYCSYHLKQTTLLEICKDFKPRTEAV
jgi:hypothetical protein